MNRSVLTSRIAIALLFSLLAVMGARAQSGDGALEITVAGGEFRPIPLGAPGFFAPPGEAATLAAQIREVALADLAGSGLFRIIPPDAYIEKIDDFDAEPRYADWQAINADALVTGSANIESDGRIRVRFRLFDSFASGQVEGLQFFADPADFRRIGHKIADAIYTRMTGEGPYFDSRIAYVHESGPKNARVKRLAIMDQDGANNRFLTDGRQLVMTPRFSPNDQEIIYISFERGEPQIFLYNIATGQSEILGNFPGMSFAPRFSPDGRQVVLSLSEGGNTDIYSMELATRRLRRLTDSPAIETGASYSPDGRQIVFESDRGGGPQIYVMSALGGPATRISFGDGRYGTPVWSPRGDLIAFTKQGGGRFSVGVMRVDGSEERILDSSFLSEGPTWAPNGRVLSFFRESAGANGSASLWSVDITGRNLKRLDAPGAGSDPAWSPILP
ncbi:Tol-Pal system beta propeller repeat protein TolB [Pikeienuella sp. HZG-20]|uniref:Tol-Pal system beta propeller repeat protein TolB n=1 Tax=Paludibacillus litoralis TaxID=3133267 RepID=UPI0030EB35CD